MVILHAYRAWNEGALEGFGDAFVVSALLFSVFFCVLEHLFSFFVKGIVPVFVSVLPAFLIYFLVDDIENMPYLGMAVIISAVFRLVFGLLPFSGKIVVYSSFILAAAAVYLNFGVHVFSGENRAEIYTFVCIVVLLLSSIQQLFIEKGRGVFPFSYFAIIGILIAFIPVTDAPIDWTPVIEAGERIARGAGDIYDTASYYFSGLFEGGSLSTGYSSLSNVGGRAYGSEKTELILTTVEKPYVIYQDSETDEYMKRRRSVYLVGGRGVDKENLVMFMQMLYAQDVTKDTAMLFSHRSEVEVEYAYLRTKDEIVPRGSYKLSTMGKEFDTGTSTLVHKKGYRVKASYLDLDFGSPYLAALIKNASILDGTKAASYDELGDYMKTLYNVDIRNIVSEAEFAQIMQEYAPDTSSDSAGEQIDSYAGNKSLQEALDTTGCSNEMKELAIGLTDGLESDYDKARAIEEYLRHYTYSLEIAEGKEQSVDMNTADGMSGLAKAFLLETGKGYCIHYTSAMVMLLRLSGIPARPALGFCYLYPFEEEEAYRVSGSSAHTWPEAYFENVGWVPFEPTATYPTAQSLSWNKVAKEVDIAAEGSIETGSADWYKEYIDSGYGDAFPEFTEEIAKEEADYNDAWRIVKIAAIVAFGVAALFALLLVGTVIVRKLRYRHGTPEQKLRMDVEQIKKLIRKKSKEDFFDRGFLSDYVKRAPESLRPELEYVFEAFYRLEYGGQVGDCVTTDDTVRAREVLIVLSTWNKKHESETH